MKKPYLLFATPRSGSWPIYHTILESLKSTREIQGLGELFNLDFQTFYEKDGSVISHKYPQAIKEEDRTRLLSSRGALEIASLVRQKRWSLIASTPERYFFKVFPGQLGTEYYESLYEKFEWIFLERENLFSQLLSFLVSLNTDLWHAHRGIQIAPQSLKATGDQIAAFENLVWLYHLHKKTMRPGRIVFYEEFCRFGPARVLTQIGLKDDLDFSKIKLPEIQNLESKEVFFSNLEEIKVRYRQTFLNQLYTID